MKIYTRTGDAGSTALFGGGRVAKSHPRVEAYGTVDELNAFIGRAIGSLHVEVSRERLALIQHDLFGLGAHLASPPPAKGRRRPELPKLPTGRPGEMEAWMDEAEGELEPLRAFILPGGSQGAAELHVCRTVCRRAERAVVALAALEGGPAATPSSPADPQAETAPASEGLSVAVRYLNRLSDLLFVLARLENRRSGTPDVTWKKEEG